MGVGVGERERAVTCATKLQSTPWQMAGLWAAAVDGVRAAARAPAPTVRPIAVPTTLAGAPASPAPPPQDYYSLLCIHPDVWPRHMASRLVIHPWFEVGHRSGPAEPQRAAHALECSRAQPPADALHATTRSIAREGG
jgi:hypothetical protein